MKKYFLLTASYLIYSSILSQDLIITGIIDGPLSGGTPKAIELYATADIADLGLYNISSANNGGGTDGPEFTLSGSASSGDFIYIATESTQFSNWFGFAPDLTTSVANNNGDDAIELFYDATGLFAGGESVIDVFGDINATPGAWSYLDGWAYRNNASGPDASTFTIGNWSFSGANALDGTSTNAGASAPFPNGTYSPVVGDFTAPVWSPTFPYLQNVTPVSFDIVGQIDEPGTIYYVVIPNDAVAPNSSQVVAGSAPGATLFSGSVAVPTGLSTVFTSVSGLVEGLDYDVYVVAEDDEGTPNVQASPIKLNFPPEQIAITEFMNNALGVGAEATNEWIELFNYGLNAVDLTGWSISDEGSDNDIIGAITINPGNYVILAKSKVSFESQWLGGVPDTRVIDQAMTLADGADEIILSNSNSEVVWSLAYPATGTEGVATYLGYSENSVTTVYGSSASPGINRNGNDVSGSIGYEDSGDGLAYSSSTGDTGSPLDGEYAQPLPVELMGFEGKTDNGSTILTWRTMTELNNKGFEIQKSIDGSNFFRIGFVGGNGNSNEIIAYNFIDANSYESAYYRLNQIDFDGRQELSSTIHVGHYLGSKIIIYPNPIAERVFININEKLFTLIVMDLKGRILFNKPVSKEEAEQKLLSLVKGIYSVRIIGLNEANTFRIVKD